MSGQDLSEYVEAYLAIRDERERILKEYETADADLKSDMAQIEALMLSACNEVNAESVKTPLGTIMRKLNERYVCNDWDGFRQFVLDNQVPDLFEKRIHQGNIKVFLSEHEGDGLPPGVSVMREYGITVRRSSAKN